MLNKLKQGHWPIFLLSSLSSVANLFLPIILVRILSPEDIGYYKIFFLHLAAIPFLFLTGGPINSVYYWIGKAKEERNGYLAATWQLTAILSLLILIIGFPLTGFLATHLNFDPLYIVIMLIVGFLWCPAGHYTETQIALGKTAKGSLYGTSFQILKVALFIFIAWKYKDVKYVFLSYAIVLSIQFTATLIFGLRNKTLTLKLEKEKIKEVWIYCLPISISGTLGFFVDKIDQLILASSLDPTSFAFYSMGCLVVPPLILIDMSVQKVMIPNLSATYNKHDFKEAAFHFKKGISDICYLIIPAVAGLFYFAEPITTLLYTDKYINSVPFMQAFAFSYLLYCIPHDAVPRATGHTSWILKIYLAVTPISLIAVYLVATNSTALNTLIVAIIVKFIPKIAGLIYSKKLMNWSWAEMFPIKKLSLYIALASTLCFSSGLAKPFFPNDQIWFFVCGACFAIIYLGSFSLFPKLRDMK